MTHWRDLGWRRLLPLAVLGLVLALDAELALAPGTAFLLAAGAVVVLVAVEVSDPLIAAMVDPRVQAAQRHQAAGRRHRAAGDYAAAVREADLALGRLRGSRQRRAMAVAAGDAALYRLSLGRFEEAADLNDIAQRLAGGAGARWMARTLAFNRLVAVVAAHDRAAVDALAAPLLRGRFRPRTLHLLAEEALSRGDVGAAEDLAAQAAAEPAAETSVTPALRSYLVGRIALQRGRTAEARALLERSLALVDAQPDSRAGRLLHLAIADLLLEGRERAETRFAEGAALVRGVDVAMTAAAAAAALAAAARRDGDQEAAARLLETRARMLERAAGPVDDGRFLHLLPAGAAGSTSATGGDSTGGVTHPGAGISPVGSAEPALERLLAAEARPGAEAPPGRRFAGLAGTAASLGLSMLVLLPAFDPWTATGLLLLVAVHEMGHVAVAAALGIRTAAPIFLGPLGAFVRLREQPREPAQMALVALGGPLVGTLGALAMGAAGAAQPAGPLHDRLLALAQLGVFLNLFNLLPIPPLDGGVVAGTLNRWVPAAGGGVLCLLSLLVLQHAGLSHPSLLLIPALGVLAAWAGFRTWRRPARGARGRIAAAYAATLALGVAGVLLVTPMALASTPALRPAAISGSRIDGQTWTAAVPPPFIAVTGTDREQLSLRHELGGGGYTLIGVAAVTARLGGAGADAARQAADAALGWDGVEEIGELRMVTLAGEPAARISFRQPDGHGDLKRVELVAAAHGGAVYIVELQTYPQEADPDLAAFEQLLAGWRWT